MVVFAAIYYFAQLLAVVIFVSVSLMTENLRGLRESLRHKIRTYDTKSFNLVVVEFANVLGQVCSPVLTFPLLKFKSLLFSSITETSVLDTIAKMFVLVQMF